MVAKHNALTKERNARPAAQPRDPRAVQDLAAKTDPTKLDRLIHERIRLGIVSALAVNESLSFNNLKRLLKTTDGNLSVHARKLEEAKYIICKKTFEGRIPKTEFRIAAEGRRAFKLYLDRMEALIQTMRGE